jgi:hypothetical protein
MTPSLSLGPLRTIQRRHTKHSVHLLFVLRIERQTPTQCCIGTAGIWTSVRVCIASNIPMVIERDKFSRMLLPPRGVEDYLIGIFWVGAIVGRSIDVSSRRKHLMIDGINSILYGFNSRCGAIQMMSADAEIARAAVHLEADGIIATAGTRLATMPEAAQPCP